VLTLICRLAGTLTALSNDESVRLPASQLTERIPKPAAKVLAETDSETLNARIESSYPSSDMVAAGALHSRL
jgi:hypothetical protein